MARSGVEVIASRGCSRLLLPGMQSSSASAASSSVSASVSRSAAAAARRSSGGPFAGLVVCVTGLSKEARGQVKEAAERLGGEYSGSLHPKCTHLVVQISLHAPMGHSAFFKISSTAMFVSQNSGYSHASFLNAQHSFAGRKFEHALKHGPRNGLFVVTLGWFVNCVRRNMRLDESLYSMKNIGENGRPLGEFNQLVGAPVDEKSCLPPMVFQDKACSDTTQKHQLQAHREEPEHDVFVFTNHMIYIDPGISGEMKKKISDAATKEGAKLLDHWFIGCLATYVVCEDTSVKRYVGHSDIIVTPLWILKTVKEKNLQRLVHLSSDLARQVAVVLENFHTSQENKKLGSVPCLNSNSSGLLSTRGEIVEIHQERQKFVEVAKRDIRDRRVRRMQEFYRSLFPQEREEAGETHVLH